MTISILTFCSHLLFIYLSYYLLTTVIDWAKFTKTYPENQGRLRLLVLLFSLVLGYLTSHFFLELLNIGRELSLNF